MSLHQTKPSLSIMTASVSPAAVYGKHTAAHHFADKSLNTTLEYPLTVILESYSYTKNCCTK